MLRFTPLLQQNQSGDAREAAARPRLLHNARAQTCIRRRRLTLEQKLLGRLHAVAARLHAPPSEAAAAGQQGTQARIQAAASHCHTQTSSCFIVRARWRTQQHKGLHALGWPLTCALSRARSQPLQMASNAATNTQCHHSALRQHRQSIGFSSWLGVQKQSQKNTLQHKPAAAANTVMIKALCAHKRRNRQSRSITNEQQHKHARQNAAAENSCCNQNHQPYSTCSNNTAARRPRTCCMQPAARCGSRSPVTPRRHRRHCPG